MALTDVYKYIYNQNLMFSRASVRTNDPFRFHQAQLQATLKPVSVEKIIKYTHKFLGKLAISPKKKSSVIFTDFTLDADNNLTPAGYQQLTDQFKVPFVAPDSIEVGDESSTHGVDYLWLRFTSDGFLASVEANTAINFSLPQVASDYSLKFKQKWQYDSTAILVHQLGQTWDTSFILVFPLPKIPTPLTLTDIRAGVGNYLVQKDVPILDYYAHRL